MLYNSSGTSVPPSLDSRSKAQDFKVKPKKPPKFPLRVAKKFGVICKQCNEKFFPTGQRGPVPQYCSRSCQCKAQRERWVQEALEAAA